MTIKDFEDLLDMIKCDLKEKEKNAILHFLCPNYEKYIDTQVLKNYLKVQEKNVQAAYNSETWKIALKKINLELLLDAQKQENVICSNLDDRHDLHNQDVPESITQAEVFQMILSLYVKHLSLPQREKLIKYAIIGSQATVKGAEEKVKKYEKIDYMQNLINYRYFF